MPEDAAPQQVARLMHGYLVTQLLSVAAKLGIPERAIDQPAVIRMDLHMLTLLHGRERTTSEFQRLLAAAGLRLVRWVPSRSPAGLGVLEAARSVR